MTKSLLKAKGVLYNIQRYSLHDGPGIRTTVFFKGCPLKCPWCANPESQKIEVEEMSSQKVGYSISVQDVLGVVLRDKAFYRRSSGGMTLSGGEPLMQPEFASALAKEAKKENTHIAIETSGYSKWEIFWKVIEKIDLVLLDIKMMDSQQHQEVVGTSNEIILENAKKAVEKNKEVIFRIPVIPRYNDSQDNLFKTANFAKDIGVKEIHLLPYHRLGESKYKQLGRAYELDGVTPPTREALRIIARSMQGESGVEVVVV